MNPIVDFSRNELSLRSKVKSYRRRVDEISVYLEKAPLDWGKFQIEFNQELNGIFRDIMNYEKEKLGRGEEDKAYKLKQLFVNRIRRDFVRGEYIIRSLKKPYGYAGDFKIIDDIYRNQPTTLGLDRLYDNYFQMSTICNAVRNRKEDFEQLILEFIKQRQGALIKVMDLASGSCRDILEILRNPNLPKKNVVFCCYENDDRAIEYAKALIQEDERVYFFKQNAVRLALKKDIENIIDDRYDLIYSTGLFDYLDYRVSVRLIQNLRKILNVGGILAISDVRDKFSNPSLYFMEWVADWNLVYRDDDNFRSLFLEAGFSPNELSFQYEQQGVMQYIVAKRSIA